MTTASAVPASGHFDVDKAAWEVTLEEIQAAIRKVDPEDPTPQLTISNLVVDEILDLSFETIDKRVILHNCSLGGLVATRASLLGLELYSVTIPSIDLEWAHVDGDVRLFDVGPPGVAGAGPGENQPDPPRYTSVWSLGAVITGEVTLPLSIVSEDQADDLIARRRPTADAGAGDFSWSVLFEAVGLTTALTAWVAIVGGATLWARMESIDAPALPTLAALGQTWMVTAGLQTLLVPILLGASVALLVYYSRWAPNPTSWPRDLATRPVARVDAEQHPEAADAPATPATESEEAIPAGAPGPSAETRRGQLTPADLEPGDSWQLHRARPLVAFGLLRRQMPRSAVLPFAVVGAMLAAALYVAQAAWEVLVTTLVVLVAGVAAAGTGEPATSRGDSNQAAPSMDARREHERSRRVRDRRGVVAAVGCAAMLTWLVWFFGHAPLGGAFLAAGVSAVLVRLLLAAAQRTGSSSPAFAWATVLVAVTGVCLSLLVTVTLGWLLFMAAITMLSLWVSLGALLDRSHGAAALTIFVAIVVWSGALQYAREIGDRTPEFPQAEVVLDDGVTLKGLLVGRTNDVVLLADTKSESGHREVDVIPAEQVDQVTYGAEIVPDGIADPALDGGGESTWWKPWTWSFLLPDDVKDDRETDADTGDAGEEPIQPEYTPEMEGPFVAAKALDLLDAKVDGGPVRVELLGVERTDVVVYLWMRVVNMDHRGSRNAADMLGLSRGAFDSPRLVDARTEHVYEVSRTSSRCDCARDLDTVDLDPHEERTIEAEFLLPSTVSRVDVIVPSFGTFHDVDVE